MKRFCNTCAKTMVENCYVLGFVAVKMISSKEM